MGNGELTETPTSENEVYATLIAPINQESVRNLAAFLSRASMANVSHIHLLLQSFGGMIGDGICAYSLLKGCSMPLTIYNCGAVQSAAVLAYIGAATRKVSPYAAFMAHSCAVGSQGAGPHALKSIARSMEIDNERAEGIIHKHASLSDEQWAIYQNRDLWLSAEEAIANGIADEIGEFCPPAGTQVHAV